MLNKKISKYIPLFSDSKINKTELMSKILCQLTYDELVRLKSNTPKLFHTLFKVNYLRAPKAIFLTLWCVYSSIFGLELCM